MGVPVSKALRLNQFPPGPPRLEPTGRSNFTEIDDLSREVYGVLGLPIDALDLPAVLQSIGSATSPLLISTPNVNFLIASRSNPEFRQSLLMSDRCLADGMPVVWLARLLGLPIKQRISGSDLFDALKTEPRSGPKLKVFLFGGEEGAAQTVSDNLNSQAGGLVCVGVLNPGFGTVDEISSEAIVETINSSRADLLAVFFGATKAQAWLLLNHERLTIPIRAQFGATINFQAGLVRRAPKHMREAGLEWLWRIKEEPYLWRRYWDDGLKLLYLVLTDVLPLMVSARWERFKGANRVGQLVAELNEDNRDVSINLSGFLFARYADKAIPYFREALSTKKQIIIDVSKARGIDPRFFGLFLMLHKHMLRRGRGLMFTGVTPKIRRTFRLNGFDFLL
jgi:N-acetylglucosaminyldiphosphoundecaprenol N-acetyl-beta-D-mannosaminyltransferase